MKKLRFSRFYDFVKSLNISLGAKIILQETMSLSREEGYIWADNSYFMELYNISNKSVSRYIKELSDKEYIVVSGTNQHRKIHLSETRNIDILPGQFDPNLVHLPGQIVHLPGQFDSPYSIILINKLINIQQSTFFKEKKQPNPVPSSQAVRGKNHSRPVKYISSPTDDPNFTPTFLD